MVLVPPSHFGLLVMGFIESVSYVMRVLLLPNIFVGLLALIALLVKSLRERQYNS